MSVTRTIKANVPTQVNTHTLGVEVYPSASSITVDFHYNSITSVATVDSKQLISTHDNDVYKYNGNTITASGTTYYELDAYESGVTPAKLYNMYDEPLQSQTLFTANTTEELGSSSTIDTTSPRKITVNNNLYESIGNETILGTTYRVWYYDQDIYTLNGTPSVGDISYQKNESYTLGSSSITAATFYVVTVNGVNYSCDLTKFIKPTWRQYWPFTDENSNVIYLPSNAMEFYVGQAVNTYTGTATTGSNITAISGETITVDGQEYTYNHYIAPRIISGSNYYQFDQDGTKNTAVFVQSIIPAVGDPTYSITESFTEGSDTVSSVSYPTMTVDNVVYTFASFELPYYKYTDSNNNSLYTNNGLAVYGGTYYEKTTTMSEFGSISAITKPTLTTNSVTYTGNDTYKTISGTNYYEFVSSDDAKRYCVSINPDTTDIAWTITISGTVTPYTTLGMPFSVAGTGWQTDTDKVTITNEYPISGNYVINSDETAAFKIGLITATQAVVSEQTLTKNAVSTWEGHYQWDNNDVKVWSDSEDLAVGDSLYFSSDHPSYNQQTVKTVTEGSVNCTVSYSVTGDSYTQVGSALTDKNNTICNVPKYVYLKFSQNVEITEE